MAIGSNTQGLRAKSALVILLCVLGGGALYSKQGSGLRRPLSGQDDFVGNAACAACHSEITKSFRESPHGGTLVPMAVAPIRSRLVGQRYRDPTRDAELEFVEIEGKLFVRCERYGDGRPVELQWCFGSGQHAHTLVGVLQEPGGPQWLLQCRLSWYAQTEQVGLTSGESPSPEAHGIAWLGQVSDEGQLRRCFGCHTTRLPTRAEAIDFERIVPGVQCERCHGARKQHVAAAGTASGDTSVPGLKRKTALDSIRWCGGCHRSDDLLGATEPDPRNLQLARFAPIGLAQSACFRNSAPAQQFTCLTCHDPHRPAQHDPVTYSVSCRQCHEAGASSTGVSCRVQPQAQECVSCHMPKVSVGEAMCTDHWIRLPETKARSLSEAPH